MNFIREKRQLDGIGKRSMDVIRERNFVKMKRIGERSSLFFKEEIKKLKEGEL